MFNLIAYLDNTVLKHIRSLNPLNAKLNPICHMLALLGAHHILHISRIKVKVRILYVELNFSSAVINP